MKTIINTDVAMSGGVKPSSNATFHDRIKTFFESIQVVSSRINEVHCGILKVIKRYRNTSRKTIINCFTRQSGMTALTKAIAFTLAETLVVMGIIGVVAALTIPNLNQSTGDREKVAKVKKIYSNIEDALGRATAVYGPMETWFVNDGDEPELTSTRLAQRFQDFMKVTKDCGYGADNMSGCFLDDSALFNGSDAAQTRATSYYFTTADGTSFGMYKKYDGGIWILVDIDGPNKGKTTLGSDVFLFELDYEGNFINNGSGNFEKSVGGPIAWGDSLITQWVIKNDNMDYLKCPDDLNWETKTSCK